MNFFHGKECKKERKLHLFLSCYKLLQIIILLNLTLKKLCPAGEASHKQ